MRIEASAFARSSGGADRSAWGAADLGEIDVAALWLDRLAGFWFMSYVRVMNIPSARRASIAAGSFLAGGPVVGAEEKPRTRGGQVRGQRCALMEHRSQAQARMGS